MSYKDLIDLDEDAEMIDLGVASFETEGSPSPNESELGTSPNIYSPDVAH